MAVEWTQSGQSWCFGTKCLAITFVSDKTDAKTKKEVQERFEVDITELPDDIDLSSYIESR